MIHPDIKFENILLHEGDAFLTGFGIVLAVQEAGGAPTDDLTFPECARSRE